MGVNKSRAEECPSIYVCPGVSLFTRPHRNNQVATEVDDKNKKTPLIFSTIISKKGEKHGRGMLKEKRHTGEIFKQHTYSSGTLIYTNRAYPIETCYPQSVLSSEKHAHFFIFQS